VEDVMREISDHGGAVTKEHPKGRPLARKMVRGIGFVLHGCLGYALYRDYIPKHPMTGMKLPKLEKKPQTQILDANEFENVLHLAAGTRLFPLVVLAEATGLRRGELCALLWSDLDTATGVLTVNKSVEETKAQGLRLKSTKSGKPRDLVVPTYALEVLEQWRKEQARDRELYGAEYAGHGLMFCRPDGEYYRPKPVSARVREVMRKAGLRRSLHGLRHSHASGMLSKGVPAATVAERLGHANANVTLSIYTHPLNADRDLASMVWEKERGEMLSNVIKKTKKSLYLIERRVRDLRVVVVEVFSFCGIILSVYIRSEDTAHNGGNMSDDLATLEGERSQILGRVSGIGRFAPRLNHCGCPALWEAILPLRQTSCPGS
jgi:integrase